MLLQSPPPQTKQSDESQIRYLLEEIANAFNDNDIDTLLSLHSNDVILMDPGMPLIQGKERIREMFAGFQKRQLKIQLAFDIHELEAYDRLAFARGTVYKTSSLNHTKSQHDTYRFICLFKKFGADRWLRTHVIVNSDKPDIQLDKFYDLYNNWSTIE